MIDDSSDLSDDIVPEIPRHLSFKRVFAPWHKVRKEFIRREQWNKHIKVLLTQFLRGQIKKVSETKIESANPLKCLIIPGDDLLDIRSLCRDLGTELCYIHYLGFNKSAGSDKIESRIHIAHNSVTSQKCVSSGSYVLHDPFQSIAKENSQAYQYLKEHGPFHVVNLDLCDNLFPTLNSDFTSYYSALHSLSKFQLVEMKSAWVLFLTTQIAPDEVDGELLDMICKPTKNNIQNHNDFAQALREIVPESAITHDSEVNCLALSEPQMINLFGVAIGKVLLSFCGSSTPQWKMTMHGSYLYTINETKKVSMVSLSFRFSPLSKHPTDVTGVSTIESQKPVVFDEENLALKLIPIVKDIKNVDQLLANDSTLADELLNSSADLLKMAGYDRDEYLKWVEDGEPSSN